MHRALKPGGVVCAQGESAWLHLDLIKECVGMCREARTPLGETGFARARALRSLRAEDPARQRGPDRPGLSPLTPPRCLLPPGAQVFVGGSVTYAFCAIPTYPSGQIGFILCTKAGGKTDIKQPARAPPAGLRYYTPEVHKAAFVLPKFAADELKL